MILKESLVSIGMPIYNGEKFMHKAINAILEQTYTNFELIISDNASSDGTEAICREYAAKDKRIRYVRQSTNVGAECNFKFVLDEAHGEYFMWAAHDDIFSANFIDLNQKFLSENFDYVASTSPTGFDTSSLDQQQLVDFSLDGNVFERYINFFNHCYVSHGIFYSLVRTEVLRRCEFIGQAFFAMDWAVDLYLASMGKVHRTAEGFVIFGVEGASMASNPYLSFNNNAFEIIFPLSRLTWLTIKLTTNLTFKNRMRIFYILVKLNISFTIDKLRRKVSRFRNR